MLRRKPCSSCGRNNWRINTFEDKYECMACGAIDESFTEADRVRSMSNEELADFLLGVPMRFMACDWYSIRNWLKQEVE